jgi:hypothetical protein
VKIISMEWMDPEGHPDPAQAGLDWLNARWGADDGE